VPLRMLSGDPPNERKTTNLKMRTLISHKRRSQWKP
jgi:hypothetical protein